MTGLDIGLVLTSGDLRFKKPPQITVFTKRFRKLFQSWMPGADPNRYHSVSVIPSKYYDFYTCFLFDQIYDYYRKWPDYYEYVHIGLIIYRHSSSTYKIHRIPGGKQELSVSSTIKISPVLQ